jgi:hypothetical protein
MVKHSSSSQTLVILNHILMVLIILGLLFLAISMIRAFQPMTKIQAVVMDQKDLVCPTKEVGLCMGVAYTYQSVDYTQRFILPSSHKPKVGGFIDVYIDRNKPEEASLNPPLYRNLGAGIFLLVIDVLILSICVIQMSPRSD